MGARHHRFARLVSDDDGIALPLVVTAAVVIFLLVTMALTLVTYQEMQSSRDVAQSKATHVADAGINAYLYELRRDQTYYVTNPTLGPVTNTQGSWTVTVTATAPLTLRSVGTINSRLATSTVYAQVGFPTFGDYMFATNVDLSIGSGATINGKIRSNGDISNSGRVTGRAYSAGTCTGSGTYEAGFDNNYDPLDFGKVTTDISLMAAKAQASGTNFTTSGTGYRGYQVVLNGTTATISKVVSTSNDSPSSVQALKTVAIPASGVFYFNDYVYVKGSYSAAVTIASSKDIYVIGSITAGNTNQSCTCGLVATSRIVVPTLASSLDTNLVVEAALLAQSNQVGALMSTGTWKNSLLIKGSIAQYGYNGVSGGFVLVSGGTEVGGFRSRTYTYDSRLDMNPPPMYPVLRDGSLEVKTWVEQ